MSSGNDEILPPEYYETLTDWGYRCVHPPKRMYERVIEDNDEREVVDEIQFPNGKALRRLHTVLWEKVEHVKSSKSITYDEIEIDEKLARVIENTLKDN